MYIKDKFAPCFQRYVAPTDISSEAEREQSEFKEKEMHIWNEIK